MNAALFATLPRQMMRPRRKPVHLVVDRLPAHKTSLVKTYVASINGMLMLHGLPGHAPDPLSASRLKPDQPVWSHMKRIEVARAPLRQGDKPQDKIEANAQPSSASRDWCGRSSRHQASRISTADR